MREQLNIRQNLVLYNKRWR